MTIVWSRVLSSTTSFSGSVTGSSAGGAGGGGGSASSNSIAQGGGGRNAYEGSLDIREVKEVRQSYRESRDFAKWSEDVPQEARSRCFVVFYGAEFNLKTLSCLTLYADDCAIWCQGIVYLVDEVRKASNRLHQVGTDFYTVVNM